MGIRIRKKKSKLVAGEYLSVLAEFKALEDEG